MNFWLKAFCEANGTPSSMRVMTGIIVGAFALIWVKVSWATNTLAPVTLEQAGIVLGAMGIKVFQKGKEGNGKSFETSLLTKSAIP